MNLLQRFIDSPITEKLGWSLLHSFWQIALIGLILKIALDLVGHRSASRRYKLGLIAMMATILTPIITFTLIETPDRTDMASLPPDGLTVDYDSAPLWSAKNNTSGTTDSALPTNLAPPSIKQHLPVPEVLKTDISQTDQQPGIVTSTTPSSNPWIPWMAGGWLIGIILFSTRPLIGFASARKLRRFDRNSVPQKVSSAVERLKNQLGIHRVVQIFQSSMVSVPTLVGFLRPVILLPFASVTSLSATELDAILLHELAHVRRSDLLVNLAQTIIETLLFFHPVVWWMSSVVRLERENCCDDLAVSKCSDARSLARALMTLEEKRSSSLASVALSANGGSLLTRIKRLAEPANESRRSTVSLLSTIAAVTITVAFSATLTMNSIKASPPEPIKLEDLQELTVTSLSDLYQWESHLVSDLRLIHRFWNIFTPEKRDLQGEVIEDWKPDLEFAFKLAAKDGGGPRTVTIQVGLQDGFRWSVGKGVWLMDSQWPMRYSMSEMEHQTQEAAAEQLRKAAREVIESRREKLFNDQAYEREKAALATDHAGRWVAIVDGRILASFESFENCVKAADEANRHASHRYIFRPGIDDMPQEFAHSPWITGQPNWWQLGIQFRRDNLITTTTDRWISGDKTLKVDAEGKGNIVLRSPDGGDEKTPAVSHPAVCSGMVTQQLTIVADDVKRLALNRFSVPGKVRSSTYSVDCTRVYVEVAIDQLGIKQHVVAFVVPRSTVDLDSPDNGIPSSLPTNNEDPEAPDKNGVQNENSDSELLKRLLQDAISNSGPYGPGNPGILIPHVTITPPFRKNGPEQLRKQLEKALRDAIELDLNKSNKEPSRQNENAQSENRRHESAVPDDNKDKATRSESSDTWSVKGTVRNVEGEPLPGVSLWVASGMGTLQRTGETISDANGRYEMTFTPGLLTFVINDFTKSHAEVQAATVFASLDGYSEVNLCRQGDRLMADKIPSGDSEWGSVEQVANRLIVKGKPVTIDFVMKPAANIEGFLVDQRGYLLQRRSLSITGPQLPPSSSALEQVHTDLDGRFEFSNVPVDKSWAWEFGSTRTGNAATGDFEIEEPGNHKWLVTVDFSSNPPKITSKVLTPEKETELTDVAAKEKKQRYVSGSSSVPVTIGIFKWGPESNGLIAGIRIKNRMVTPGGEQLILELAVRNVGNDPIKFESEIRRLTDTMKLIAGDGEPQEVHSVRVDHWSPVRIHTLNPGQVVTVDCGGLWIANKDVKDAPGKYPAIYPQKLAAGDYRASIEMKIPDGMHGGHENDSWRGRLTTGEVKFTVN